ncbi:MAG: DUF305 domain-containing protein [Acidobacteriota bacterium]|nr:DUF305 domain-containing protein [Acidobacteriota bacterium]
MQTSYWRFAAMIATSTLVMFGLMYIHTYTWDHASFSETRAWMALLMGAAMAIIMLGYMLNMYKNRTVNLAIFVGAILTFGLTTWLVRSQVTVSGTDYMEAMIPHHSIAILTSERSGIEDPRVRKLADEIIAAQRKEIAEMKYLIRALAHEPVPPARRPAPPPAEMAAREAARTANLATTDLESVTDAELQGMLGAGPVCRFAYAAGAAAVAAATAPGAGAGRGVIKLHGRLVPMNVQYETSAGEGFELSSDDVTVVASPYERSSGDDAREANAWLRVGDDLEVGYGGFYECTQSR